MAHKKGVGSSDNGRDSNSKRLGVKIFGGQTVKAGNIIIRQRGTKYHPGDNAYLGRDFTLHAAIDGVVEFRRRRQNRVYVNIVPKEVQNNLTEAPSSPKLDKALDTVKKVKAPAKAEAPVKAKAEAPKAKAASKPKAAAKATPKSAASTAQVDKLTKIEGIGPKIDGLLKAAGIPTFAALSETSPDRIREILLAAGKRYQMHDPTTWPKQAALAAADKWDELKIYQDRLDGGKEPTE